ncbi:hypothetical protein [Pseudomonas helvetica]|uniref:hypothetical protein n=1 Tax=Pseudomonas helvetica TaxID=3136738 RepID=UPI0032653FD7
MSEKKRLNGFERATVRIASKIYFTDTTLGVFLVYGATGLACFILTATYLSFAGAHNVLLNATIITSKLLAWLGLAYGTMQKIGAPLEEEINNLRETQKKAPLLTRSDEAPWTHLWLWIVGFIFLLIATIFDIVKAAH